MRYASCIGRLNPSETVSREDIKARLRERLEANRSRELENRETIVSPHREDIVYEINGKEAKSFASQGQQKTIVLVEKLAEVKLIEQEINETPVLLLDDIMSELDRRRRRFVMANIEDMQIIITCTDLDEFTDSIGSGDAGMNKIYVEGGSALTKN